MDETFPYCHMWLENNMWGGQTSDIPQILKDVREKIYKLPVGMKLKALSARVKA
jgi:hypothetical protein